MNTDIWRIGLVFKGGVIMKLGCFLKKITGLMVIGLGGGMLLILVGHLTKFMNFKPLGGPIYAVWFIFIAFGLSFGLASKILKIWNPILVGLIVSAVFYYVLYRWIGTIIIFENFLPFGINAID